MDRNIRRLGIFYAVLIGILVLNLTWLQVIDNNKLTANAANPRRLVEEYGIQRGRILTADGVLLAESREGQGPLKFQRNYPLGTVYDHVVGYDSPQLGRTGIEAQYNDYLLAKSKVQSTLQRLTRTRKEGYDVTLTIDSAIQQAAVDALGEQRGAVVAINPRTGAVLAMASWPDCDPNLLVGQDTWEAAMSVYQTDAASPLLNRAVQGLYPPGSSFKPVTAAAAIEGANIPVTRTYDCPGEMVIGGTKVYNYDRSSFGEVDMTTAMVHSVNTYFAQLAVDTTGQTLVDFAEAGGMNQRIPLDYPEVERSAMPQAWQMNTAGLAAAGYGQGELVVTPLQMCLYGCAIANGGEIMVPHLLKDVRDQENVITKYETKTWKRMMSSATASTVLSMMREVVESGTGTRAAISGYSVAGKTGTAEVSGQPDHTWFVGIAPAQNPQIVVAVVLENSGGSGGAIAAPIARQVMMAGLQ